MSMCHRTSYTPGMARREELTVRFNIEERAAIDQRAEVDGVSAAAVLRMLVRRHLKVKKPVAKERAASLAVEPHRSPPRRVTGRKGANWSNGACTGSARGVPSLQHGRPAAGWRSVSTSPRFASPPFGWRRPRRSTAGPRPAMDVRSNGSVRACMRGSAAACGLAESSRCPARGQRRRTQ